MGKATEPDAAETKEGNGTREERSGGKAVVQDDEKRKQSDGAGAGAAGGGGTVATFASPIGVIEPPPEVKSPTSNTQHTAQHSTAPPQPPQSLVSGHTPLTLSACPCLRACMGVSCACCQL